HSEFRGPSISPNTSRFVQAHGRLKHAPVYLSDDMRAIADAAIREHAAHKRWVNHTLNVRTNHAHFVVSATGVDPERVMIESKAWATSGLRNARLVGPSTRVWTEHGSTRWLWDEKSLRDAIAYAENQ